MHSDLIRHRPITDSNRFIFTPLLLSVVLESLCGPHYMTGWLGGTHTTRLLTRGNPRHADLLSKLRFVTKKDVTGDTEMWETTHEIVTRIPASHNLFSIREG